MKKRFIYNSILSQLNNKKIVVLVGARQVGKTTLLKQIKKNLIKNNKQSYYFTLEDKDILKEFNENPKNLFNYINMKNKAKQYVFIDEIQYLNNPSSFLKYLYDEHNSKIKLIVSGSSSFYIDKNFKDSLSGRKKLYILYPLSFEEILYFKDIELNKNPNKLLVRQLNGIFQEYAIWGGYPEVITSTTQEEKKEILFDIVYSYIKKDILEQNIKREDKFYLLLKFLASQIGSLLNKNEISRSIGISTTAVDNYLYFTQKSFYVSLVNPMFKNRKKEIVKMPKVYFNDIGIRNFLLKDFRNINDRDEKIKGQVLENLFFLKFLNSNINLDEINYWRSKTGIEIDFILKSKKAYEITYNCNKNKTKNILTFKEQFPSIPVKLLCIDDFYKKY